MSLVPVSVVNLFQLLSVLHDHPGTLAAWSNMAYIPSLRGI